MPSRRLIVATTAFIALLAVGMAVLSVKLSPLDQSDAGFGVAAPALRVLPDGQGAEGYFELVNRTGSDDRLLSAAPPAALMRPVADGDGLRQIAGGIALPDGARHVFGPDGDRLLLTGAGPAAAEGGLVDVVLTFERAGEITIKLPVSAAD